MRFRIATSLLLAAALAAPLAAAEAGHGEAGGGPFEGNVGNVLWTLVVFALVVLVLGKFAWGPILSGLQEREKFIHDSLASAKKDRDEAEARLRDYTEKLTAARAEATAIVDEGRRDADAVKRRIEQEAHVEAGKIFERAKREIAIAQQTAVKDLYAVATRLTTDVAAKILEREIRPADHERLIRDAIAEISVAVGPGADPAAKLAAEPGGKPEN